MPIPSFTDGYPPDGSTLGQTKVIIRNNIDGTFQTVAVDHFDNNNANAGHHKFVVFPNSLVAPTTPTGANTTILYNGGSFIGGANNVFFLPPSSPNLAAAIQMTRNEKPAVTGFNGFSWLPGGFLLQWGQVTGAPVADGTQVNFPITFTNLYSITLGGSDTSGNIATNPMSYRNSDGAKFFLSTNSSSFIAVSWMAIGN